MAKVGILSMQRIINYGSFLQAYGLKMILEKLGHNVEFVDYHVGKPLVESDEKNYSGIRKRLYKGIEALKYNAPLKHRIQYIKYKKSFASKYHQILGIKEQMNYTPELDTLVIGSDEVFNCIQKNPNVGYSLELFGKDNRAKKLVSYAASFGNTTIEKLEKYGKTDEIKEHLSKFDAISVRDKNSRDIVVKLVGKEPLCHLDPVLAYDFIGECTLIPKIDIKEKYLILYAYSGRISDSEAQFISKYAKRKGLKVYAIGGVQSCADKFIDCSPFEVLSYFLNAEAVITDTFHGTIFSVITKRPFATIVRKSEGISYGNEEKLNDLLNILKLNNRAVGHIDEIENILSLVIDYDLVGEIIREERRRTYDYLEREV